MEISWVSMNARRHFPIELALFFPIFHVPIYRQNNDCVHKYTRVRADTFKHTKFTWNRWKKTDA